jgi:hypothetical protein
MNQTTILATTISLGIGYITYRILEPKRDSDEDCILERIICLCPAFMASIMCYQMILDNESSGECIIK